jgi:isoamylase
MRPALIPIFVLAMLGCSASDKPRLYFSQPFPPDRVVADVPPSLYSEMVEGQTKIGVDAEGIKKLHFLGASILEDPDGTYRGTNFSVYSQRAEKVQLLLFDDPESNQATRQFEMERTGDVWNVYVEGVGLGQAYGYIAWGPNWTYDPAWYPGSSLGFIADVDFAGNRFNPNKLLFDPYCKAFTRDHDWSKGSLGTGAMRAQSTYAAAMKCVIVKSQHQWSDEERAFQQQRKDDNWKGHRPNDLILYEVHIKGFTANSASGVEHLGTYRGLGEKADYFKDLGITALEMLPPFEKSLDSGYWGYNTLSFFAPELSYATRHERAEAIDEFKWMVQELHQRGIEVVLDVVYNHTGEGGLWREKIYQQGATKPWNLDPQDIASLYSYRGLDNASYYALPPTIPREYCDYTSVGNTTRCNSPPMRRLIVDSLRYWVQEMHVDGFRFDLAPALGAKDLAFGNCPTSSQKQQTAGITWDPANTVVQDIIDDPVLLAHNTRIIAEPWGGGGYSIGQFPASTVRPKVGWSEWNGWFRDWARSFVNYDDWGISNKDIDGGNVLTGTSKLFAGNKRRPYNSINFITIHDGFTMYDLVSYDKKVNDCSPLNPICCSSPLSAFCDEAKNSGTDDNRSRNWGDEAKKRQVMRGFFTLMMIAQGTPMIYGGDEWMRTQLGNNNTYTPEADNSYSWYDWGNWGSRDENHRMHDFVRKVILFRKQHAYAFAPESYDSVPFEWKSPLNGAPDWASRQLMIHYTDRSRGPELAILINMGNDTVNFQLPAGRWQRLLDTQSYFDGAQYLNDKQLPLRESANISLATPPQVPNGTYGVPTRSIVVLEGI